MKAGILICGLLLGAVIWNAIAAVPTAWSQEPPPAAAADADAPEVLTRGPIHEAFAEPVTEPEPGIIVPKKPPADIDEVPPEYAPDLEGANWIKGYWAWDDERDDFIWISGVHRVPPPGMRWVAGFWNEVEGAGWQWNRGFWMRADVEELSYREAPPATLEAGPSSPSPGDDYFYVPGNWTYDTDYRWSPGYWALYRPDWVWVPAHWVWTPGGYVFIPGYCDYGVARRGCLYAPVYFGSAFYTRPGYYYRPWCVLNVANLMVHFWVRPNYCHYYFGNYYGVWDHCGLTPWYQWSYHHHHHCYDPILSWSDVHYHRRGINYSQRISGWHKHYERHEHDRPPRTWNDQVKLVSQTNITNITQINNIKNDAVRQNFLVAKVDDLAKVEDGPVRLRKLEGKQLETANERAKLMDQEIVQLREQRRKFEKPVSLPKVDKSGEVAQAEPAPSEAKGSDNEVTKGAKADRGNKSRADTTAESRGAARGKLKLPEQKIKPIVAKVDVPPAPTRGTPRAAPREGRAENSGAKGLEKTKAAGGEVRSDRADSPAGAKGKGANRERGGDNTPKIETPKVKLPENRPAPAPGEGAAPRIEPREQSPQRPMPRGLPRPDRTPKSPDSGNKSEAPRIERPAARPAADLPAPRSNGPPANTPRTERGNDAAPKITRPAATERAAGSTPRVEVPRNVQPRVETPRSEPRTAAPRVEVSRPQPRVEVPRPQPQVTQPRIQSSQPRAERSQPRSEPRGSSRSRKRDSSLLSPTPPSL